MVSNTLHSFSLNWDEPKRAPRKSYIQENHCTLIIMTCAVYVDVAIHRPRLIFTHALHDSTVHVRVFTGRSLPTQNLIGPKLATKLMCIH